MSHTMIWDISIRKHFVSAARHFELDVRFRSAASRLVLFGPSGAGKSQTLKMIAGLSRPDAGHVRVRGQLLYEHDTGLDLPPQKRGLAYVFQDYALFPHLTVTQNIAFALTAGMFNPGRRTRHDQVDRWLEAFGLTAVAQLYPGQISGGQRQRTALARALVAQPRALLLDEPFAALDSALREHLREELLELQVQCGIPLILITHDEADVLRLAEEVVYLDGGGVVIKEEQSHGQDAEVVGV